MESNQATTTNDQPVRLTWRAVLVGLLTLGLSIALIVSLLPMSSFAPPL